MNENPVLPPAGEHLCPVCGKYTFPARNSFDICEVCGWEDDVVQLIDPDLEDGANEMCLKKYRAAYESGWRPDWLGADDEDDTDDDVDDVDDVDEETVTVDDDEESNDDDSSFRLTLAISGGALIAAAAAAAAFIFRRRNRKKR